MQNGINPDVAQAMNQYLNIYTGGGGGAFSVANIIAWIIFGAVGFVAFVYGKKQQIWPAFFIGLALMVYPYFVVNTIALYVVGAVLCVALYYFRQ